MPPFDTLIAPSLKELAPQAIVSVKTWPTEGKTLAELEQAARETVRGLRPDLVIVSVPPGVTAASEEEFFRSYSWIMNWSLSFGHQEWDCLVVHPGVSHPDVTTPHSDLIRQLVRAQDLTLIDRATGDESSAESILVKALKQAW